MFRIEFLKLKNHPQLGNIELNFSEVSEENNFEKPYTSVIIGPNGTGKSFILRTISEIFRQFKAYSVSDKKEFNLPFDCHLRYKLDKNTYEIVTSKVKNFDKKGKKREYIYFKNRPLSVDFKGTKLFETKTGYEVEYNEIEFPNKLIVNSIIPTDRFVYQDSKPEGFYQYLGVRSTSSTTSTKSSVRRTIKHIFNAVSSSAEFVQNLKDLLLFLDFKANLKVEYKTKINRLFFSKTLTKVDFRTYFENWWNEDFEFTSRKKENPLWSVPYYNQHFKNDDALTDAIVDYLNQLPNNPKMYHDKKNSSSKIITVDLFDDEVTDKDLIMISHIENLDIVNLEGIQIVKSNKPLSIADISSGEYHLLISLIGMFASIDNNSLVLIDEPEISLHPNWQMRYISFLKKVFAKFSSSHFILTTHSHFLISDLEGKSSSVIALSRDMETDLLSSELLEGQDTFGWSPDDILYNVFDVTSSRNKFVAEDIANILDTLSKGSRDGLNTINKETYDTLVHLGKSLKDNDPLKEVVKSILRKVN